MEQYENQTHNRRTRRLIGWLQAVLGIALVAVAPLALANFITIDFSAVVQEEGGTASSSVTGQFVLDTSVPFQVGAAGVGGVIAGGSFESDDVSGVADLDSPFTGAYAGSANSFRSAYISLVADYGPQLFVLELTSDVWFPSSNVYDVLTPELALEDLLPFDPTEPVTTQFQYFTSDGGFTIFEGALTSLSISVSSPVPATGTVWLFAIGLVGWGWLRRPVPERKR